MSWYLGDLTAGQSREFNIVTMATQPGDQNQRIRGHGGPGPASQADVATRVEGLSALLMELVDGDDPLEIGADTTYEIRVTNTGSKTETNLEVECTIPEGMKLQTVKCASGVSHRVTGSKVIFTPLARLASRADVLYRVQVQGIRAGDQRFRGRMINADGLSQPVLREESTRVYGDEIVPTAGRSKSGL